MKLEDYVKDNIARYPGLYVGFDYEISRLHVLDHTFLVLGNGMEWAETGDSKTGGYMVHPKSVKRKGEWTRVKDKPYGKEKYTGPDIDRFFTDDWIEVNILDPKNFDLLHTVYNAQPVWEGFLSDLPQELLSESIERNYRYKDGIFVQDNSEFHIKIFGKNEFLFAPEQLNLVNPKYLIEVETHRDFIKHHAGSRNFFAPYPFCEKSWAYAEIDPKLIQPDWRQGMIDVMQASLDYYNNTPYGHENMAYNQYARDFSEKISEYCQRWQNRKTNT